MPDGDLLVFSWDRVTAAGYCMPERGRPFLFVYRSEGDKLVTIPKEHSDFDILSSTLKKQTPFQEVSLLREETIQDRLKTMLKIKSTEDDPD